MNAVKKACDLAAANTPGFIPKTQGGASLSQNIFLYHCMYNKYLPQRNATLQKPKDGFKLAGVISVAVYKTMCT